MSFKDDMIGDLDVFFNQDEFAEAVTINGIRVIGMLEQLKKSSAEKAAELAVTGMVENQQIFFTKTVDVPKGIFVGSQIYLNDKSFIVKNLNDNGGVTEITLTAVSGRN